MILEEGHVLRDTAKYAEPLSLDFYRELVIRIGYIMHAHSDKIGIQDIANLKIAQATICQLGLEKELELNKKLISELKGGKDEI